MVPIEMAMIYIPLHHYYDDSIYYALKNSQNRFKNHPNPYPKIDEVFEEENRCKIAYDRDKKPVMLMFEEEDWFWFKAKWLCEN